MFCLLVISYKYSLKIKFKLKCYIWKNIKNILFVVFILYLLEHQQHFYCFRNHQR